MDLIVLGANHKTAPANVRDEIQLGPDEMGTFYSHIREFREILPELAVLSTCNRTEFYGLARDREAADHALREAVYLHKGILHLNNGKYTYSWAGRDTVQHLFRVAAGVDSMMVGEPQILGQVREAFDLAEKHRGAGALLTRLFNNAVHVGKRARAETEIGKGTVSVAYAAVEMAQKIFDGLQHHSVLVIGAGETGALAARHFSDAQPRALTVVNRTFEKARELASDLGGRAVPWEEMDDALVDARVVVAATGAQEPILDQTRMERVLKRSGRGPKVLVDISNPRNIHPEVGDLDRIFLYDLDALESIAEQNRVRRRKEIPKVEGIVAEEVDRFLAWYDSLEMVPVIRALRGRFEEIAGKEMQKQSKNFHPSDREALRAYTRALLNKLLHQPTTRIRNVEPTSTHGLHKLVAIQELFELDVDAYSNGSREPRQDEGEEEE
ncbi:MAG: glutamyl-tRNA reductase [Gemmatimonadota bacterium]|jgi:glutamyl-tRNA reductase